MTNELPAVSSSAPADRAALRDRDRALALLEAADFLRDAHFRDGLSVQEIGTALRHAADAADPMVGSLARDGFGLDEIAAMLDLAALPAPAEAEFEFRGTAEIRAAALREAAARYEDMLAKATTSDDPRYWTAVRDVTLGLRRLAGEARDERETQAPQPDAESPGEPEMGTLPAWLHQRFTSSGVSWENLDDAERSYWEHQARAVRRAVTRGGFKTAEQPAAVAQQPQEADGDRIVAYQSPGGTALFCTRHRDELSPYWPPVFSEDLPDGGICTYSTCGVDVLIPQQPEAAEGAQQ
jgi:hypothetical protein